VNDANAGSDSTSKSGVAANGKSEARVGNHADDDGKTGVPGQAALSQSETTDLPPSGEVPLPDIAPPELVTDGTMPEDALGSIPTKIKTLLIGKPRDLSDQKVFGHVTLVAFLAWVGLGADGLSSSCYGPPEAFANLGEHQYLAVFLSFATILTVLVISSCYSHIIEAFPSGGGGYLVASKLLGRPVGVVSGCALLVDYVLTITVSIAAAGDALFGLVGPEWLTWKHPAEAGAIIVLIILNLRGVKESVIILMPIFIIFLITHAIMILGAFVLHTSGAGLVVHEVTHEVQKSLSDPQVGLWGMLGLLLHAYSLGAGTYTGIEAVSNSMPVMREPRVATAKRTMIYMALSLSLMAGGLMLAYLLLKIQPEEGKTLNLVLTESFVSELGLGGSWIGGAFVLVAIFSEGALLFVAAQAGFIDGPRVLANMAHDSWMPHWFANLSERLATHNGILLMGLSALAALAATGGNLLTLVIMYSINVFLTFSLSMLGMCRHWYSLRGQSPIWKRRLALFGFGAMLCLSILVITVYEKFDEGGWRTVGVTGGCILLCALVQRHYTGLKKRLHRLDETLAQLSSYGQPVTAPPDPHLPSAAILVGGYNGLGVHTMLNAIRFAPGHFKSIVFLSVGVVDSGNFKGAGAVDDLRHHAEESLGQYVDLANRLGLPATSYLSIGTDAVDELEHLCLTVAKQFPKAIFFAGKLVFQKDTFFQRLLHNQTAYSLQQRLQWSGLPMVILPTRVR
jgi:amino acid transporter